MNTIDRDGVIEECAMVCERHAKAHEQASETASTEDWREISVNQSLGAEACAGAIRALKSQPAQPCSKPNALQVAFEKIHGLTQPDPRDEALRLARDELKHIIKQWPDSFAARGARSTLAAIDALKGK